MLLSVAIQFDVINVYRMARIYTSLLLADSVSSSPLHKLSFLISFMISFLFIHQQLVVFLFVLQLTFERCHQSCAQGHQTLSWLRWPQAGSKPDWGTASAAGGRSHSPLALLDRPC